MGAGSSASDGRGGSRGNSPPAPGSQPGPPRGAGANHSHPSLAPDGRAARPADGPAPGAPQQQYHVVTFHPVGPVQSRAMHGGAAGARLPRGTRHPNPRSSAGPHAGHHHHAVGGPGGDPGLPAHLFHADSGLAHERTGGGLDIYARDDQEEAMLLEAAVVQSIMAYSEQEAQEKALSHALAMRDQEADDSVKLNHPADLGQAERMGSQKAASVMLPKSAAGALAAAAAAAAESTKKRDSTQPHAEATASPAPAAVIAGVCLRAESGTPGSFSLGTPATPANITSVTITPEAADKLRKAIEAANSQEDVTPVVSVTPATEEDACLAASLKRLVDEADDAEAPPPVPIQAAATSATDAPQGGSQPETQVPSANGSTATMPPPRQQLGEKVGAARAMFEDAARPGCVEEAEKLKQRNDSRKSAAPSWAPVPAGADYSAGRVVSTQQRKVLAPVQWITPSAVAGSAISGAMKRNNSDAGAAGGQER